ncbi:MAG: DUF4124 domain-containing protein [Pseudomonadota bacterium]
MAMTTTLRAAALLVGALLAAPAGATMYRCGNVFQDRPCDAGVTEQRITPGGARPAAAPANPPAPVAAVSPFAVACARVGETAQRIVWKREGGATLEKQVNEAHGNADLVATINAVYARRGTAPEIRTAIETECVAERTKQAEAAEALKALQKQAGPASPVQAAPAPAADAAPAAAVVPAAAKPNPMCTSWRRDLASIEAQLRAGGKAAAMESLQNQRRSTEKQLSDAKC